MDQPSWSDTFRATLGSCLPCLTCGASRSNPAHTGSGDSDDEYSNSNGVRGVRRARPDELEGLLVDSNSADEGWRDDDAAADADAMSLHSHLGPRGRRRAPPRTPRHISFWGYNLFGSGRVALDGGDEALHAPAPGKRSKPRRSTDDLLARAALEPAPTQLRDVTSADVARRARAGSTASQSEAGEPDLERRARRKARKEMRRLAAALAEAPRTPESGEFEGFPGSGGGGLTPTAHRAIPAPFLQLSSAPPDAVAHLQAADAVAHLQAAEDDEAADLDGLAYARLAPRPMGGSQSQSRSSGRSSNSGSGAGPFSPVGGAYSVGGGAPRFPCPYPHSSLSSFNSNPFLTFFSDSQTHTHTPAPSPKSPKAKASVATNPNRAPRPPHSRRRRLPPLGFPLSCRSATVTRPSDSATRASTSTMRLGPLRTPMPSHMPETRASTARRVGSTVRLVGLRVSVLAKRERGSYAKPSRARGSRAAGAGSGSAGRGRGWGGFDLGPWVFALNEGYGRYVGTVDIGLGTRWTG
ncbi:hypothetical protein B0H12DRAFT_1125600 [Mycena haematopus]|nr:hypothetical protein B0H12DRAFT_1125600 [Mycena haematopus]